jgi:type IV pilus assembly protein PilX
VRPTLANARRSQRGVTLVIVLLLLLLVTILGLAAMRGTILQERMSGNVAARAQAFQLAEAVLREAEASLTSRPVMPGAGCAAGLCAMAVGGAQPAWEAANFWTTAGGYATSSFQQGDNIQRYVIEDMGDGIGVSAGCTTQEDMSAPECTTAGTANRNYRITVFSQMSNGAEVMLQTSYQIP